MSLEAGNGFISGLVSTNPVGATDPKSQGDDHIRLIKVALLGTFPNLTGAVTPTQTELNYVDGVTSAIQTQLDGKAASSHVHSAADLTSGTVPDARFPATLPAASGVNLTALNGTNIASGTVPDARLSSNVPLKDASNTYTHATQSIVPASGNFSRLVVTRSTQSATFGVSSVGGQLTTSEIAGDATIVGTSGVTLAPSSALAAYRIDSSGNHDFKAGAVLASTIANSTSTTLVAGQLHFITGNATLPNLTAGQWVQVVNDSGSAITISKNGSDTTYWTATGASVSTSFTLAARGVLTARCTPAGNVVYVSGSGITGAT